MPKESRKKGKINGIKEQKTKQTHNRSQQSRKSVLWNRVIMNILRKMTGEESFKYTNKQRQEWKGHSYR